MTKNWAKVVEACILAAASAIVLMALIYGVPDCQPIHGYQPHNDTAHVTSHPSELVTADAASDSSNSTTHSVHVHR